MRQPSFHANLPSDAIIRHWAVTAALIIGTLPTLTHALPPRVFGNPVGSFGGDTVGVFLPLPPSGGGLAPGTTDPPEAPATVAIIDRQATSITLRWRDRAELEDGNRIYRREDGGSWTLVAELAPPDQEWVFYDDEGLIPDTHYAYQIRPFNANGESFSPVRRAYTSGDPAYPVWRAQIEIRTANVRGGGTDNGVSVRLNSAVGAILPALNQTWVDYGGNDFEPGSRKTYDLDLGSINELADIIIVSIAKPGGDALCLEGFALLVNGVRVYDEDFATESDPGIWLHNEGDYSTMYTAFHETLRAHPLWSGYRQPGIPLSFSYEELQSRIESLVGHVLHDTDELYWGELNGSEYVELSTVDAETIHVDLDLAADVFGNDPSVDIDFDLRFELGCDADSGEVRVAIRALNFDVSVDFDFLTSALANILPCEARFILGGSSEDCIASLEGYIANRIRRAWEPLATTLTFETDGDLCANPPSLCVDNFAQVAVCFPAALDNGVGPARFPRALAIAGELFAQPDAGVGAIERIAREAPVFYGDGDADGDVDMADYVEMTACFTGPEGVVTEDCLRFDFDNDGDVDLPDYVGFQANFTGPR